MFEIHCGNFHLEPTVLGYRNISCLLADDNAYSIGRLAHSESRPVTQTEFLGDVGVVAYRKDAAYGSNAVAGNDHRAVVERRVLEKYILNKSYIDVGVDFVAGAFIVGK